MGVLMNVYTLQANVGAFTNLVSSIGLKIGRRQHSALRRSFLAQVDTGTLISKAYPSRLTQTQLAHALQCIESLSSGGWSHRTKTNQLDRSKRYSFLYRETNKKETYAAYKALFEPGTTSPADTSLRVGRDTFFTLLDCVTSQTKAMSGVSYFRDEVVRAMNFLAEIVERIRVLVIELHSAGRIVSRTPYEAEELNGILTAMRTAIFDCFFSHVVVPTESAQQCDGDVMHCVRFAMGWPCPVAETTHHTMRCRECAPAFYGPYVIQKAVDSVIAEAVAKNESLKLRDRPEDEPTFYDELVSMKAGIATAAIAIRAYHAHMLRGKSQQATLRSLVDGLDDSTMVVVVDWMMKVNPHACY